MPLLPPPLTFVALHAPNSRLPSNPSPPSLTVMHPPPQFHCTQTVGARPRRNAQARRRVGVDRESAAVGSRSGLGVGHGQRAGREKRCHTGGQRAVEAAARSWRSGPVVLAGAARDGEERQRCFDDARLEGVLIWISNVTSPSHCVKKGNDDVQTNF